MDRRTRRGGWLAMQWKTHGGFPSLTALAARLGMFDPDDLRVDEVWYSWEAMADAQPFTREPKE